MLDALGQHLPHNDIPELVVEYLAGDSVLDRDPDTILKVFPHPRRAVEADDIWIYKYTFMDREHKFLHSYNDEPSVIVFAPRIEAILAEYWHRNGKLHRDGNKPAVESDMGFTWYQYGEIQDKPTFSASKKVA